jgi:hypothetical protein
VDNTEEGSGERLLQHSPATHLVTFTQVSTAGGGGIPTQTLLVRPTITIGNKGGTTTTYLTLLKPVDHNQVMSK